MGGSSEPALEGGAAGLEELEPEPEEQQGAQGGAGPQSIAERKAALLARPEHNPRRALCGAHS